MYVFVYLYVYSIYFWMHLWLTKNVQELTQLAWSCVNIKKNIQHPHYLPAFPSFPAFSTAAGFSCSPNNKNLPLQVASLSLGIQRAGCNHCSNAWLTKRPTMWSHVWKFGENRGLEIAAIGRFFGLTFWAKRKKIIKLGIVGADLRDSQSIEFIPESSQL